MSGTITLTSLLLPFNHPSLNGLSSACVILLHVHQE